INDVSVTEGNTATLTLTLDRTCENPVTVNWATAAGTATAGTDYATDSGSVTFAPGETSKTITVTAVDDTLDENNELFYVNLSGAVNATITDGQGGVTIVDNDSAVASIDDITVTEGDGSAVSAAFTISLSTASDHTIS